MDPLVILCTYETCLHQHTWASRGALVDTLARVPWVDHDTGAAVCACHYPAAQVTFPCDTALGRNVAR